MTNEEAVRPLGKGGPPLSPNEYLLLVKLEAAQVTGENVQAHPKLLKSLIKKGYVAPVPKQEREQQSFAA